MKKIILHIGSEKTGTTYLQNLLSANRDILLKSGIYYPEIGFSKTAHFSLVAALHEVDHGIPLEFAPQDKTYTIESEWMPLINELNSQKKAHTVILSAEHFSSRLRQKGLEKLKEILSQLNGYEISIIYYARSEDDFFESWYSTFIKAGGKESIESTYQKLRYNKWMFDHHFILKLWSEFLPEAQIHAISYDEEKQNGTLLSRFKQLVGIPENLPLLIPQNIDTNCAWSAEMIAFARAVNIQLADVLGNKRYMLLEKIASSQIFVGDSGKRHLLEPWKREDLISTYKESRSNLIEFGLTLSEKQINKSSQDFTCPDNISLSPQFIMDKFFSYVDKVS